MRTGILILAGAVAIAAAIGWYQYLSLIHI